jgi:hypothetical protein
MEEINALRIYEQKIVRKIDEPIKKGEHWKIRTNKEIQDTLHGTDTLKFIKIPLTKMVWSH